MKSLLTRIITLSILLFFYLLVDAQIQIEPRMPSEPGKHYSKCLVDYTIENHSSYTLMPVDPENFAAFCNRIYLEEPASQKWVKKKAEKGCESDDPNDCLVWCLVETPKKISTQYDCSYTEILIESYLSNPDYFYLKEQSKRGIVPETGQKEWREIFTKNDPNYESTFEQVKDALINKGYSLTMDSDTVSLKSVLVNFQRDHLLPVSGSLDLITLEAAFNPHLLKPEYDKYCKLITKGNQLTRIDTVTYEGYVYIGDSPQKLNFADYINLSKIKSKDYNPNNERHAIINNKKFDKLFQESPSDFENVVQSIIYQKTIKNDGEELYDCICPSYEHLIELEDRVEAALKKLGYETDGMFGRITKQSLSKYQIKNDRPIGVIDLETLDLLGVEY